MKAWLLSPWNLYGLALMSAAPALLVLAFPPVGLAALLVGSALVPLSIATGTMTSLNFPIVCLPFLLLLWAVQTGWRGDLRRYLAPPFLGLWLFLAVAALSLLLGNSPRWAFAFAVYPQPWFELAQTAPLHAQLGQLGLFVLSACTLLLVAEQVRSLRWLQGLTWLFILLGGAFIVTRSVPEFRWLARDLLQPGAEGSLLSAWLVALAFTQALFNTRLPPGLRIALAALVAATFHASLTGDVDWLAGWVPALAAVTAALLFGFPRIAVGLGIAAAGVLALNAETWWNVVVSTDNSYSLMTRVEAWRVLVSIIAANPLLGLGPANYYHATVLLPILGWNVHFSSHNNYVDIIAQTGFLGFGCFLLVIWQVGRMAWRITKRAPPGFARAYAHGTLAGLSGTLVAGMLGDWFLPFVYNVGLRGFRTSLLGWFFLGGLVALDRLTQPSAPRGAGRPLRSDGA